MRTGLCVIISLLAGLGVAAAKEFKVGPHVFTVPDGFEIAQVAGPPLVDRPIVADYDDAGHLYVADSAGVNDKVEKQLKERPHRIVRLSDVDGDGVYDKSVVFADKMMFPEGLLCHDGAVYCAAPPSIWKLEDTDGDGVADKRTEWFNVGTLTGCANDLHGPYLGPTGWIYWTKGAFAQVDLKMGDGSRLRDKAAHIFRARPDGSGLESFAAGGMDNPVDVTFGESGDVFFSSTFLIQPRQGKRDGLIHGMYGGVYPKRHGVIAGLPRTGELLSAMAHLGPAASCGLATYRSSVFGKEYRGNLFSCLFNMRKVMRHELTPEGASFRSADSDFVVSDQVDFHPTDVQEDADGSLLVLDTGGWYKLCCPTSVLAKPDVLGAIYRVRKKGAPGPADARGLKIAWESRSPAQLVALLNDARPVVRSRAIAALGTRGKAVLPQLEAALTQKSDPERALGALWASARIRTPEGAAVVRKALGSPFPAVQQAGAYVCGLERISGSLPGLLALLESGTLSVKREAATALGRLDNPAATRALLNCDNRRGNIPPGPDRHLEHALVYALIEINDPDTVRWHLVRGAENNLPYPEAMRAYWALDQMKDGRLGAAEALRGAGGSPALPILKRHPEWQGEIATHFEELVRRANTSTDSVLPGGLQHFVHLPKVAKVVSDALLDEELDGRVLQSLQRVIATSSAGGERPLPSELLPGLEKAILAARKTEKGPVFPVTILGGIKPEQLTPALGGHLAKLSSDPSHDEHFAAIEVLASCGRTLPDAAFTTAYETLGSARWHEAARVMSKARLTEEQREGLTEFLPQAGVAQMSLLLEAYRKGGTAELGRKLARGLAASSAIRTVPADDLAKLAAAFPAAVRPALLAARPKDPGAEELQARLDKLEAGLLKGDRRRGHQVFKSTGAACSTCHRVAYEGGDVGPDLTRIGAIRSQRDLLEAIVAPSASYARGYEPMIVTTDAGQSHMGRLSHGERSISLTDAAGRTTTIPSSKVKAVELAPASLMPAGIDQALRPQELADLLAFLQSLK